MDCPSPAFKKQTWSKNAKGTKPRDLIMCRFYPCNVKLWQIVYMLRVELEHSRSNLVYKICYHFGSATEFRPHPNEYGFIKNG